MPPQSPAATHQKSRYRRTDQSVIRALRLVQHLMAAGKPMRITELTTLTAMPKSTVHRLMTSLCEAGLLKQEAHSDRYDLGPLAFQMVHMLLQRGGPDILAYPELKELAASTGEEVNLGVPLGDTMVYVQKIHTERALRIDIPVGSQVPMHCTAIGKAYLAAKGWETFTHLPLARHTDHTITYWPHLIRDLEETARLGYSTDREEFLDGVTCVGAAIIVPPGTPVGAIAIQAPSVRMPTERQRSLGDAVKDCAQRISERLASFRLS